MSDYILSKAKLKYWLEDIRRRNELWAPVGEGDSVSYLKNPQGEDVATEFTNSLDCPKYIFCPQQDPICNYEIKGRGEVFIEPIEPDTTPRVVFGMRPPDIRGLDIMDAYLLNDNVDERYKAKKDNTTTICIGYHNPPPCCFAEAVGVDLFPKKGSDILLTDLGRSYYVETLSEKGENLVSEHFNEADDIVRSEAWGIQKKNKGKTNFVLNLEKWKDFTDSEIYTLPYWDEIYLGIIPDSVATRYFYSGTYFKIVDVAKGNHGTRYKTWTTMYSPNFSVLNNGYDYKPSLKEKFKDWILEMFHFFPKRHGFIGCSGAHRCIAGMTTKHDIRKIIANVDFGT